MAKKKTTGPIEGAEIKTVRKGAITTPTIIADRAKDLKAGDVIEFIPSNGITYTGEIDAVVGDQVFFKDGVKPV